MPPGKASHWGEESEASRREGHGRNDVPEKSSLPLPWSQIHRTWLSFPYIKMKQSITTTRIIGTCGFLAPPEVMYLHNNSGIPTVLCPSFVEPASTSCFWWPPGTAWSGHTECSRRAGVLPGQPKVEGNMSYLVTKHWREKTSRCISCQDFLLILSCNFFPCLACKGSNHHISMDDCKSNLWGQFSRFCLCGADKVAQPSEG